MTNTEPAAPDTRPDCDAHPFMGIASILPWCSFCGHMANARCHRG